MGKKIQILILLFGVFSLASTSFSKEEEKAIDISLDLGYRAISLEPDSSVVRHEMLIGMGLSSQYFEASLLVPFLAFANPTSLSKTHLTAGDIELGLATGELETSSTKVGNNEVKGSFQVGLDIIFPTGVLKYETGWDVYLFNPSFTANLIIDDPFGTWNISFYNTYGASIGLSTGDQEDNYYEGVLTLGYTFPHEIDLSFGVGYGFDFNSLQAHYDGMPHQVFVSFGLGAMLNDFIGLNLEGTYSVYGDAFAEDSLRTSLMLTFYF